MSRLIEMLDRAQSGSGAIGFGASRQRAANPSIVLIGRTTASELEDSPGLTELAVDAVLVVLDASDGAAVARVSAVLNGVLWGARVGSVSAADVRGLREAGCDFLVFDAEDTEATVLNDGEIGKILAYNPDAPDFDEDAAKTIRILNIDGVLLTPPDGLLPLTVQRLMAIKAACAPVGRRTILTAPSEIGAAEVEALRNAGVMGLVVSPAWGDDLRRMRDDIAGLPRQTQGGGGRMLAPRTVGIRGDQDDYRNE